jgi:phosphate transport system permease protein
VVLPTGFGGVLTGVALAIARAGGETAPLLLTALGNQFFSLDLLRPMAALPLEIYDYARSPYTEWHTRAWGASLVLILVIGSLNLLARLSTRRIGGK